MNPAGLTGEGSVPSQTAFSTIRDFCIVHLEDNIGGDAIEQLETRLLDALFADQRLKGVILDFSEVCTSDQADLQRLHTMIRTIRLVGGRIGLCGINPGLAALMVLADLGFHRQTIGSDIDDLLGKLEC
ncbi:MAG: STAS domain-containing protein [Cyanobium sp.]|nr:STAS domain-containing protein [Cyanobium sp.]